MPPLPLTPRDLGALLDIDMSSYNEHIGGVNPGNTSVAGGFLYGGSGVPAAGLGNNGDFYLRTDTPGTLAQRIYIKSGGSWVNALA